MPTMRERSKKVIQRGMRRKKTLLLSGALVALDTVLPMFVDFMPRGAFIAVSFIVGIGAFFVKNGGADED